MQIISFVTALITLLTFPFISIAEEDTQQKTNKKNLQVSFNGDAKIEVGSHYVGVEFHHGYSVPQRFSFFYPVANSIDLSTDYWKRDTTFVMDVGLKFGDQKIRWLNNQSLPFDLTPFSVDFHKDENEQSIDISYSFTKDKPAVVISYTVTNKSNETKEVELYTRFALSFRTSHTFNLKDKIQSEAEATGEVIYANHTDYETQNAQIFILNAAEKPYYYQINESIKTEEDKFKLLFPDNILVDDPSANFVYKKKLQPNEKFLITQILGTCKQHEGKEIINYLKVNYKKEVEAFENSILSKIYENSTFHSGDEYIDRSVLWAKAILEVNKHYINGEIMPMPCPAEYNFYFTHDVLMTDLAAVKFDLKRVKKDLEFIAKLANKDKIIPHAYYWKDSAYVTEFANQDNWNNFWFIIVSAEYLKHSGDTLLVERLYPYIEKSLKQALQTKGNDDLMWSYRPDWWDIGKRYGQRSYMTILAIKAIRSFLYLASVLNKDEQNLIEYEQLSERMGKILNEKLWFDKYGYLMNYSDPDVIDEHFYCGSLLAAHYELIDTSKILRMINTADQKIVDKKVGVYTAYPVDFDEHQDFWHFVNNEAGDKYYYLNGGIWYHSNAWYALALISYGKKKEAAQFIKDVMTIDGIMNGPNGQPAMYEVRNGNCNAPQIYGTVDKPQFMWAAGWYIYSLYYLFGLKNNEWNVVLDPFLLNGQNECIFDLYINGQLSKVKLTNKKNQQIFLDGKEIDSFVLPHKIANTKEIMIMLGKMQNAYLKNTNSILEKFDFNKNKMTIQLKAFNGHRNETVIVSKQKPKQIRLNGETIDDVNIIQSNNECKIKIEFIHQEKSEELTIQF